MLNKKGGRNFSSPGAPGGGGGGGAPRKYIRKKDYAKSSDLNIFLYQEHRGVEGEGGHLGGGQKLSFDIYNLALEFWLPGMPGGGGGGGGAGEAIPGKLGGGGGGGGAVPDRERGNILSKSVCVCVCVCV